MSRDTITALLWLIPAIFLSTTSELFLKRGMNQIGTFDIASVDGIVPMLVKIFTNPFILVGFVGFGGGSIFWLSVISRVPLSLAYPMLAASYIIIVLEAWFFLGEGLHPLRVIGSIVVGIGIVLVGLSGSGK